MSGQSIGSEKVPVRPEDMEVTMAVRRDLGTHNDQAVIGEFLDRVGSAIDARVDARVDTRVEARISAAARSGGGRQPSIALGIVSIVAGIPITGIVLGVSQGSVGGVIALIVVWVAMAAVNFAYAR